jgi:hypothetical protein
MHELEYSLTISLDLGDDRLAAFSIVLVGNQIAESVSVASRSRKGIDGIHIDRFCGDSGLNSGRRRAPGVRVSA